MGDHGREVDAAGLESSMIIRVMFRQQSVVNQSFDADEQRIARERGEALIGRIAVAGRSERQYLPEPLTGGPEEVDEFEGARPEVPDTKATGQRSRMEQKAAATERHSSLLRKPLVLTAKPAASGWPRTGARSGAEACPVITAFCRAPEWAVRGQDPPRCVNTSGFWD